MCIHRGRGGLLFGRIRNLQFKCEQQSFVFLVNYYANIFFGCKLFPQHNAVFAVKECVCTAGNQFKCKFAALSPLFPMTKSMQIIRTRGPVIDKPSDLNPYFHGLVWTLSSHIFRFWQWQLPPGSCARAWWWRGLVFAKLASSGGRFPYHRLGQVAFVETNLCIRGFQD